MNSETPETDKAYTSICRRYDANGNIYSEDHIPADFARRLELRNKRLVEALRACADKLERVSASARGANNHSEHTLVVLQQAREALAEQQEENPEMDYIPPGAPSDFNED